MMASNRQVCHSGICSWEDRWNAMAPSAQSNNMINSKHKYKNYNSCGKNGNGTAEASQLGVVVAAMAAVAVAAFQCCVVVW
jgi:hypothetical protein